MSEQDKTNVADDAFDMYQPFVTNEQKFKYWEESKAEIKRLNAASQHYEREIEHWKLITSDQKILIEGLKGECKEMGTTDICLALAHKDTKITKLSAQVNQLREALETAKYELEMQWCNEPYADENSLLSYNMVIQALSTTAPQCLQAFENEVIEKCANVCDEMAIKYDISIDPVEELIACETSAAIRALKSKK